MAQSKLKMSVGKGKVTFDLPYSISAYIYDANLEIITFKLFIDDYPRYIWTAGADWLIEGNQLTVEDESAFEGIIQINK